MGAAFGEGSRKMKSSNLGVEKSHVLATGPLRAHPSNPRYFTDGSGKAIYLTGSHTWNNFTDRGTGDPPAPFDFDSYLDFLQEYGHNFVRPKGISLYRTPIEP